MGKKKRIAKLTTQAYGYLAQLREIVDGADRMRSLRARQLDKVRLDETLARYWDDELVATIVSEDEDRLRAAIAPYVRAAHLRRLWDTYAEAGPELDDLADLEDGADLGDLQTWRDMTFGVDGP